MAIKFCAFASVIDNATNHHNYSAYGTWFRGTCSTAVTKNSRICVIEFIFQHTDLYRAGFCTHTKDVVPNIELPKLKNTGLIYIATIAILGAVQPASHAMHVHICEYALFKVVNLVTTTPCQ